MIGPGCRRRRPERKAKDFVPCATPTERTVERVWQELLGYDDAPLDAQADFVSLGGNSLLAGRATTKLRLALNLRALPGTSMYLYPTITELASYLDTLPKADVQVEEKVVEVVYKGHSSTAPDAVFYQATVVVGSLLLDQAPSIVTHAAIYVTWRQFNACVAAQVGVLVSLVCSCVLVLVAILANKWMVPVPHGIVRIPLFSGPYMRWLAAQHATRAAAQAVAAYGAGTPLLAAFYGACGAAVGDDVVLDAGVTVDDPQFVSLDTKVRCRRHAKVSAHVVERGELVLAPVVLERGAELGIRFGVGAGGLVKADHAVDALAHVEGGAREPRRRRRCSRPAAAAAAPISARLPVCSGSAVVIVVRGLLDVRRPPGRGALSERPVTHRRVGVPTNTVRSVLRPHGGPQTTHYW